jgi:hypothetical protein
MERLAAFVTELRAGANRWLVVMVRASRPPAHKPGPKLVAPGPVIVDDKDRPGSPYPSRELRIFAGLKAWGVITKFYPYLDLPNEWDAELPHALSELEAAPRPACGAASPSSTRTRSPSGWPGPWA